MTLSRRRFLTISAACAALPSTAKAHSWHGHAFGAEISMTIRGDEAQATVALKRARHLITEVEQLFSLYNPASDLRKLNTTGVLLRPDGRFLEMMQASTVAHALSDGLFDPTVQPLWQALAEGRDPTDANALMGWHKLRFDTEQITLAPSQALTFNGIAQGYATDLVADAFEAMGLKDTLVNMGEYRGTGGPWTLGISDPIHGNLGNRRLTTGAIATSSPSATLLSQQGHILHSQAKPKWSTVSVEAATATLADSLSTAMVLAPRDQIEAMKEQSDIIRITLIGFDGDLMTI